MLEFQVKTIYCASPKEKLAGELECGGWIPATGSSAAEATHAHISAGS